MQGYVHTFSIIFTTNISTYIFLIHVMFLDRERWWIEAMDWFLDWMNGWWLVVLTETQIKSNYFSC